MAPPTPTDRQDRQAGNRRNKKKKNLFSLLLSSLLLTSLAALVPRLHREPGDKATNTSLVLAVLGVLACANRLSQRGTTLENQQIAQDAQPSPLEVRLGAIGVPQVKSEPEGLLGREVRVTRERPEPVDHEATLQVLGGVLVLVGLGDARVRVVVGLGAVELPLLLVCEVFDDDERKGEAREEEVREGEGRCCRRRRGGVFHLRQQEEVVGWRGDREQQQGLRGTDEHNVEDEEQKPVVDLAAHVLPAVVLRSDLVATFAPVVVGQAELLRPD